MDIKASFAIYWLCGLEETIASLSLWVSTDKRGKIILLWQHDPHDREGEKHREQTERDSVPSCPWFASCTPSPAYDSKILDTYKAQNEGWRSWTFLVWWVCEVNTLAMGQGWKEWVGNFSMRGGYSVTGVYNPPRWLQGSNEIISVKIFCIQ